MRNSLTMPIFAVVAALVLASVAAAQTGQSNQSNSGANPWKYYPKNRAVGDGGPAPKRDLTGTWAGPQSGAGVPDLKTEPAPPFTPLGKQMFDLNKPIGKFSPAATNDNVARSCDPMGVPQNAIQEVRALSFATIPNRIIICLLYTSPSPRD